MLPYADVCYALQRSAGTPRSSNTSLQTSASVSTRQHMSACETPHSSTTSISLKSQTAPHSGGAAETDVEMESSAAETGEARQSERMRAEREREVWSGLREGFLEEAVWGSDDAAVSVRAAAARNRR